jgi:hypothetical protein
MAGKKQGVEGSPTSERKEPRVQVWTGSKDTRADPLSRDRRAKSTSVPIRRYGAATRLITSAKLLLCSFNATLSYLQIFLSSLGSHLMHHEVKVLTAELAALCILQPSSPCQPKLFFIQFVLELPAF